jgi:predicted nucleotidyltransferase
MLDIATFKPRIDELCRRVKVNRLDVFGSATDESFGDLSDVDVLVRFEPDGEGLFNRYFDLKEGLEEIFGRPVDVVIEDAIRNPYFKAGIEHGRRNVYAA